MPTAGRAASAILAHQDPSSASERPLCTSKPRHRVRACREQVRLRVLADRGWVGDRAELQIALAMSPSMPMTAPRCSPMDSVGTVARGLHSLPLSASLWDGTGMSADSQGITMVTSETRTRKRHMIASSDSMRLSEEPRDPERNARTVQESCLVSAQSGPTISGSRANSRHDVRRSSVDQAEGLGHQRRNPKCYEGRGGMRARVRTDAIGKAGLDLIWSIRYRRTWHVAHST